MSNYIFKVYISPSSYKKWLKNTIKKDNKFLISQSLMYNIMQLIIIEILYSQVLRSGSLQLKHIKLLRFYEHKEIKK